MTPRKLITIDELCRDWLNVRPEWFARTRNRQALKAEGFPDPVPGMGRRWDPVAIKTWLDAKSGIGPNISVERGVGGAATIDADPIATAQATLQRRLIRMGVQA